MDVHRLLVFHILLLLHRICALLGELLPVFTRILGFLKLVIDPTSIP